MGRFDKAFCPDADTFREELPIVIEHLKGQEDKKIIMYCTGGVRCERISVLCKKYTKAQEIKHLKNGIHAYVEKYPDGYFRGSNYVFDDRISIRINEDILSNCDLCDISSDKYNNCLNAICNKHYICCDSCFSSVNIMHSFEQQFLYLI